MTVAVLQRPLHETDGRPGDGSRAFEELESHQDWHFHAKTRLAASSVTLCPADTVVTCKLVTCKLMTLAISRHGDANSWGRSMA